MKRILRILIYGAGLVLIVVGLGYGWLITSLPQIDGEATVASLSDNVTIGRTADGLATIRAENDADAWRALGYVHAQDRLWQLESTRRFAMGRLSEAAGEITLEIDIRQRRLGLERLAKQQYDDVSPYVRRALDAYSDGVNAYLANRSGALPLEFIALNHEPMKWEPWHGLLWGRLMGYQLSSRWRQDIARQALLEKWGPARLRALWPDMDIPEHTGRDHPTLENSSKAEPPMGASNAWAIAPKRSDSGAALLAGDPHLGLRTPGTWYAVRLEIGDRFIEGASAPGTPFIVLGRNNDLAWSITSNEVDLQDLRRVNRDEVTRREERVFLKDGQFKTIEVFDFFGAPVVAGGLVDGTSEFGLALHATALQERDRTPNALYRLNQAGSVGAAIDALQDFTAPFMNFHLADRAGAIAMVHAGLLPIRERGTDGRFIRATDGPPWRTRLAHTLLTPDFGEASGFVGNANERTDELDALGFPVPGDWPAKTRGARLEELLREKPTFNLEDMIRMQADTFDVTFRAWRRVLDDMSVTDQAQAAKEILLAWDGRMDRDLAAPLIFAAWLAEIDNDLFVDVDGADVGRLPVPGPHELPMMMTKERGWCAVRNCMASATRSFDLTVRNLKNTYGFDLDDWRWGDAHQAPFDHTLLSRIPGVGPMFSRPIETDGGNRTLNRGASRGGSSTASFRHVHGAGFRAVHDMSSSTSRYMLAPGQSGNPLSPHYGDLLERWRDVTFVGFDAPVEDVLTLTP